MSITRFQKLDDWIGEHNKECREEGSRDWVLLSKYRWLIRTKSNQRQNA